MLNERLTGYLNYFERLSAQPPNRWEGFYLTKNEDGNFGLRFQLAFACYALGVICLHPDATEEEQERCRTAMAALIDRMIQRRVWAYWALSLDRSRYDITADPIAHGNAQYSAHLAMMIGAFTAAGGDPRYDEPFTLLWTQDESYEYTHTALIEMIGSQMRDNRFHGVECAPGRVDAACMSHVLWAYLLHDARHGSDYAELNAEWLAFVQKRLALGGPKMPGRGALRSSYNTRNGIASLFSTNVHDAWALAFMAEPAPDLVYTLAERFLPRLRRIQTAAENVDLAYTPVTQRDAEREIATPGLATGLSYILAVELDNDELADALLAYADVRLQPVEQDGERYYDDEMVAPFVTALFAIGEAGGIRTLRRRPRPFVFSFKRAVSPDISEIASRLIDVDDEEADD